MKKYALIALSVIVVAVVVSLLLPAEKKQEKIEWPILASLNEPPNKVKHQFGNLKAGAKINQLLAQSKYDEALKYYKDEIGEPKLPPDIALYAKIFFAKGDKAKADKVISDAINSAPTKVFAVTVALRWMETLSSGVCFGKNNTTCSDYIDFTDRIAASSRGKFSLILKRQIGFNYFSSLPHLRREGQTQKYTLLRNHLSAWLKKELKAKPKDTWPHEILAKVCFHLDFDYDAAATHMRKVYESEKRVDVYLHGDYAEVLMFTKKYDEAISVCEDCLRDVPKKFESVIGPMILSNILLGDIDGANAVIDKMRKKVIKKYKTDMGCFEEYEKIIEGYEKDLQSYKAAVVEYCEYAYEPNSKYGKHLSELLVSAYKTKN